MIRQIWQKQIVSIIQFEPLDCADQKLPIPLIIKLNWNHYIGFYYEQIQQFFSSYIPYPYQMEYFWLQLKNQHLELAGTEIVSHLYQFYTDKTQPLIFVCHFRKAGKSINLDLKRYYKNNLKASTSIRFGKFGASVITVDMSVNNIDQMYTNFKKNLFENYLGQIEDDSPRLGYLFIKIPVRIISRDLMIQRAVSKYSTLSNFLNQFFNCSSNQELEVMINQKIKLKLHGIKIPSLSVTLQFLEKYCHPDGYLYFTF